MYRQKRRRPSAARVMGLLAIATTYAAVLVWAGDLAAVQPVTATAASGATAALSAPKLTSPSDLAAAGREAPLVTLAIAFALVALAGTWYASRRIRGRHPLGRRARLVVRYITALV